MCGIFGHVGNTNSFNQCLKGLEFLEYRGYDSSGIVAASEGEALLCFKEKGNLSELKKILENKLFSCQSAIGHMRWATHGKASRLNAHPILDEKKEIAIVHNGVLENHRSLRAMLEEKGYSFETDTDTEVIAQLISYFYEGNIVEAIQLAQNVMKGFWAIALIHKLYPGQIIAFRRECPIVVGISLENHEAFVSSDPKAFMRSDLDLYFLQNDECAILTKDSVTIFDSYANPIQKAPQRIHLETEEVSKGSYSHYMLKEIYDQPKSLQSALNDRFNFETADSEFEDFDLSIEELKSIKQILILACGTSWHAGCLAAQQFEELAGIPCRAEIASEYRYKNVQVSPDTLVIAISQSGETIETITAMRKVKQQGAKVLVICNSSASTMMREADYSILLKAGPEISVCSTKAFTCQLGVLSLLVLKFARNRGMSYSAGYDFLTQILSLPGIIEIVLNKKEEIGVLAKKYASHSTFFFIGRQYMHATSLEAALKLKEISYLNAYGHPAGELKHGPIALIDSNSVVIGLCGNGETYDKMLSNLTEVKARGGNVIALAPFNAEEIEEIADDVVYLPSLSDSLSCVPYSIALQLFAYLIANELGNEIDQPRNLAKSVTVE